MELEDNMDLKDVHKDLWKKWEAIHGNKELSEKELEFHEILKEKEPLKWAGE